MIWVAIDTRTFAVELSPDPCAPVSRKPRVRGAQSRKRAVSSPKRATNSKDSARKASERRERAE